MINNILFSQCHENNTWVHGQKTPVAISLNTLQEKHLIQSNFLKSMRPGPRLKGKLLLKSMFVSMW